MEGMTHLAVAYFGMLLAIALWTWTVVQRNRRMEARLEALERAGRLARSESDGKTDALSDEKASLSKAPLRDTLGEVHGNRPWRRVLLGLRCRTPAVRGPHVRALLARPDRSCEGPGKRSVGALRPVRHR